MGLGGAEASCPDMLGGRNPVTTPCSPGVLHVEVPGIPQGTTYLPSDRHLIQSPKERLVPGSPPLSLPRAIPFQVLRAPPAWCPPPPTLGKWAHKV